MKKTYIIPQIAVVKVAAVLLQASTQNMNVKGSYGSGDGITLGSRRGNSWGDDEED